MSVDELVEAFSQRSRPRSGIVSRSRLRAWFFEEGGTDEQWGVFVRALVQRVLWRPWHGDDIALSESTPASSGYREVVATASKGDLIYPSRPDLGAAVFFAGGSLMTFVIALLGDELSMLLPGGLALAFVVSLVVYLRGCKTRTLRIDGQTLHVDHETLGCELDLRDLLWVDVVQARERRELASGEKDTRLTVLAKTRDGGEHVLTEPLGRESALRICRAIESAMIDARPLQLANHGKVRVASDEEHEVVVEQATTDNREGEAAG